MTSKKSTADVIFESAQNLSQKKVNFMSVFGYGPTQLDIIEDSATQYLKAANSYKLENNWSKAAIAYIKYAKQCELIEAYSNMPTMSDINKINAYIDAVNCYLKSNESTNTNKAIKLLNKAIEYYSSNGKFGKAGKYYKQLAEIYEGQNMILETINSLKEANKLFNIESTNSNCSNELREIQTKIATLSSKYHIENFNTNNTNHTDNSDKQIPNLQESAQLFEQIAKDLYKTKLGHYSAKTYLLNSLICQMANSDTVFVKNKINEYTELDYSFVQSKEYAFVTKLIETIEQNDTESFSATCQSYDNTINLNQWQISMLLHAKNSIDELGGHFDNELEKNDNDDIEEVDLC